MKYLITGLGNPGPEYELTRHNIGFLTLDRLADRFDAVFQQDRHGWVTEIKHKGRTLVLLKPNTYMNLSGKAVNYWMQQLKVPVDNLLIITDDIALPFGKTRLKGKGSSGGHNGLKNIEMAVGGSHYPRIKMGVGSDFPKGKQVDYVLSPFNAEEVKILPEVMDKACDTVLAFATIGLNRTMNAHNG